MRAVVQRVVSASVTVEGQVTGEIGRGFVVLLGVGPADTPGVAQEMAAKIARLRVFSDEAGKMNRALAEAGGAVLSVSQFTLYADTRRGNRPSFTGAAGPEQGRTLYAAFGAALRDLGLRVEEGVFGADMQLALVNDGPVTIVLDSEV